MSEQADNQTTNLLLLSERQQEASLMPEPRRRAVAIASCLRFGNVMQPVTKQPVTPPCSSLPPAY